MPSDDLHYLTKLADAAREVLMNTAILGVDTKAELRLIVPVRTWHAIAVLATEQPNLYRVNANTGIITSMMLNLNIIADGSL